MLRHTQLTIRARLSLYEEVTTMRIIMIIGDLTGDDEQQWVTMGGHEVKLSQRERHLVAALTQNARRVAPQDTLPEYICGRGYDRVA